LTKPKLYYETRWNTVSGGELGCKENGVKGFGPTNKEEPDDLHRLIYGKPEILDRYPEPGRELDREREEKK